MNTPRYRLLGGPGSPYSLKMRAVLRYRRLLHEWLVPQGPALENPELMAAGKGVVPVLRFPDGTYQADSTPLIHVLEMRHPGDRSVFPEDPGTLFLSKLIEEFADEWLVLALFDYRWNLPEDIRFCAGRQISGWMRACPKERLDRVIEQFIQRQTTGRERVCGPPANRPIYERTYRTVLGIIEGMLADSLFLFGSRPSIGDFGLFGQLSQMAIDPTPSDLMRREAFRTYAWIHLMDDPSGIDGEWAAFSSISPTVKAFLRLAAQTHLPYVAGLEAAYRADRRHLELTIWDRPFHLDLVPLPQQTKPTGPAYAIRSLKWLKADLESLTGESRQRTEALLAETGCLPYLLFQPGEKERLTPRLPV